VFDEGRASMSFKESVISQFGNPHGILGSLAGLIMAHRSSNVRRAGWTVSLLNIQPFDRVLEIGFGPGVAIYRASLLATAGLVVGIDHSETMVRQATKRNANAIQGGKVKLIRASVSSLPAFEEPFDKVFAINSMDFWDDPVQRLQDLAELMKPGGRIALTTQPRNAGATPETSRQVGVKMVAALEAAGFSRVQVKTDPMKPPAVCAIGVR
jgi:ubiquinone/menaquinone biosynthesis C-methylase UbiE